MGSEASIILESGRCSWGKCYFCGWGKRKVHVTPQELLDKLQRFLDKKRGVEKLKIFSSGSLLDAKQFPRWVLKKILQIVKDAGVKEVVIESRVEHVLQNSLNDLIVDGLKVTVAMGLEVADDEILELLKKGQTVEEYVKAAIKLREKGLGVRTYILVNPHPIFKDMNLQQEVLNKSVKLALKYSDSIVIINTYPHVDSELWNDYIKGVWKPLDKGQFEKLVAKWESNPKVEFDFNNFAFVPRFPPEKRVKLKGVGIEYLKHPYYEVWQDYFLRFYTPPKGKIYLLFLPCAYKKPYTKSKTWKAILSGISGFPFFKKIHIVAVSSPGVIPYEYVRYYPFSHYDWEEWKETPEIKMQYIEITSVRVENYLKAHSDHYKKYIAYFRPDSETIKAIRRAFERTGLKLIEALDMETYNKIVKEGFKPAVAHPIAVERLKTILKRELIGEEDKV